MMIILCVVGLLFASGAVSSWSVAIITWYATSRRAICAVVDARPGRKTGWAVCWAVVCSVGVVPAIVLFCILCDGMCVGLGRFVEVIGVGAGASEYVWAIGLGTALSGG